MFKQPLTKRQRLLLNWGAISVFSIIALGLAYFMVKPPNPYTLNPDGSVKGVTDKLPRNVTDKAPFQFEDSRETAGITFQHFPATRRSLLPEDMGSGLAWGDYDNDGDPDLFLVNFHGSLLDPVLNDNSKGNHALYRNEGDGTFTDVLKTAGLDKSSFGLAAAWGDYDNDNDLDIYITNYGPNFLYQNNGDGTFTDVTAPAKVGDPAFNAGCVWGDYNNDGHIDLYVTNYVKFEYSAADIEAISRQYDSELPYTINPSSYPPAANRLYHNNGDGSFTDVAEKAGVANPDGRSLGATWFDFNNDGLIDLYVANDVSTNGVYHNLGDGSFADIGASSLAADYRGAMGLAVGDFEQDGDLDLFVTHWISQENAFFENMVSADLKDEQGKTRLFFTDGADMLGGLGQISLNMVGWATGFADFDNDGYLDLWVVNGNTLEIAGDNTRLKPQPMHLFHQQPHKGFVEVSRQAAPVLKKPLVGRGGAHADYDSDGKMDIAVMAHNEMPLLLHNTSTTKGHWLTLRLRQSGGNTYALGTRVIVRTGESQQTAQVGTEGSYLSQHQLDLHFGLGSATQINEITIYWPDGAVEKHQDIKSDQAATFNHIADYKP
jgi:hypothetical protein